MALGLKEANIIEPQPSVEEGMAKTLNVDMCLTSRICEGQKRWRNRVLCGHFQNICKLQLSRLSKKTSISQNCIFNAI
jgi:hypothetical protein